MRQASGLHVTRDFRRESGVIAGGEASYERTRGGWKSCDGFEQTFAHRMRDHVNHTRSGTHNDRIDDQDAGKGPRIRADELASHRDKSSRCWNCGLILDPHLDWHLDV